MIYSAFEKSMFVGIFLYNVCINDYEWFYGWSGVFLRSMRLWPSTLWFISTTISTETKQGTRSLALISVVQFVDS